MASESVILKVTVASWYIPLFDGIYHITNGQVYTTAPAPAQVEAAALARRGAAAGPQ
jgi:hypothetical protein